MIPLPSCREPLAIGEEKAAAGVSSSSEPAKEISKAKTANLPLEPARETPKAQAADPPSEPTKAAVEGEKYVVTPPEAPPLVVDLEPQAASDGDTAMADAFEVAPRPGAGTEGGSFPLPSSAAGETTKDNAMAMGPARFPALAR